jgi:hypothetical protein
MEILSVQEIIWVSITHLQAITVAGLAVSGMNSLRSLEHWDRRFESHSRHRYLCTFILFVLSCVQDSPIDYVKGQETEKAAKVQQRAVEPYIDW